MEPIVNPGSGSAFSGMDDIQRLGYWSAIVVIICVALFACTILLGLFGFFAKELAYFVCLLLAPAFVVMIACIHYQAPPGKRIWSNIGLCFAVIYTVLISIVYYVQLSAMRIADAELLPFVYTPGTVFFAIDMLGYGFMCLATWFTAGVFNTTNRLSLWIRRFFILHGWLVFPTLISTALLPSPSNVSSETVGNLLGYFALLTWCIIFIPLSSLVARYFRLMQQ